MRETFNRSPPELSEIFNTTILLLKARWGPLITCWREYFRPDNVRFAAERIAAKMGYRGALFGLLWDGTDVFIQRCGGIQALQRAVFTGHYRQHALNYLAAVTATGLFAMVVGPFAGTVNDTTAYQQAQIESKMRHLFRDVNLGRAVGDQVIAAADSAFPLSDVLLVRRDGAVLTPAEQHFNRRFSHVRIAIDWSFGKLINHFANTNWYMKLAAGQSPIGSLPLVILFLTNCHTCFYGSETGQYFNCNPPTIEEYLQ